MGCITHSTETGIDDTIDPEVVTDTVAGLTIRQNHSRDWVPVP